MISHAMISHAMISDAMISDATISGAKVFDFSALGFAHGIPALANHGEAVFRCRS